MFEIEFSNGFERASTGLITDSITGGTTVVTTGLTRGWVIVSIIGVGRGFSMIFSIGLETIVSFLGSIFSTWFMISSIVRIFVASIIFINVKIRTKPPSLFIAKRCLASLKILKNLSNKSKSKFLFFVSILSFKYIVISSQICETSYISKSLMIWFISPLLRITEKILSITLGSINPNISTTLTVVILPFEKIIAWSSNVKVSLKLPCPLLESISRASFS